MDEPATNPGRCYIISGTIALVLLHYVFVSRRKTPPKWGEFSGAGGNCRPRYALDALAHPHGGACLRPNPVCSAYEAIGISSEPRVYTSTTGVPIETW